MGICARNCCTSVPLHHYFVRVCVQMRDLFDDIHVSRARLASNVNRIVCIFFILCSDLCVRTYGCRHRRHCRHRSLPPPPLTHHSNLQIHTLYFEHNKNSLRLRANDYDNGGSVPAREHSVHSHGYMHARDEGDTGTRRGQKHSFMKQNTIHALNSFPLTQSMTSMETNVTCVVRVTRCGTRRASVCAHASICLRRPAHVSVYHLFSFFHKTS